MEIVEKKAVAIGEIASLPGVYGLKMVQSDALLPTTSFMYSVKSDFLGATHEVITSEYASVLTPSTREMTGSIIDPDGPIMYKTGASAY